MIKKPRKPSTSLDVHYDSILGDISNLIDAARRSAARSVNCIMTAAYWLVGRRIVESEQRGKERADYGEDLLKRLSTDLTDRFGRGFAKSNLYQMRAFYFSYTDILQTASGISATALPISKNIRAPEKFQTVSGISADANKRQEVSANLGLRDLTDYFPLPWSVYVRLLGIKNESNLWSGPLTQALFFS